MAYKFGKGTARRAARNVHDATGLSAAEELVGPFARAADLANKAVIAHFTGETPITNKRKLARLEDAIQADDRYKYKGTAGFQSELKAALV